MKFKFNRGDKALVYSGEYSGKIVIILEDHSSTPYTLIPGVPIRLAIMQDKMMHIEDLSWSDALIAIAHGFKVKNQFNVIHELMDFGLQCYLNKDYATNNLSDFRSGTYSIILPEEVKKPTCSGKVVTIDGKKYKLEEVE